MLKKNCFECPNMMPEIPDDAQDAWDVFMASTSQFRSSFGGFTGLDYSAIFHVSDVLGVEMTEETLQYIQNIEYSFLELQHDEDEAPLTANG